MYCQTLLLDVLMEEQCEKHHHYANAINTEENFRQVILLSFSDRLNLMEAHADLLNIECRHGVLTGCSRNQVRTATYCRASFNILENLKNNQLGVLSTFLLPLCCTSDWIHQQETILVLCNPSGPLPTVVCGKAKCMSKWIVTLQHIFSLLCILLCLEVVVS
jgi:hypothetical protein